MALASCPVCMANCLAKRRALAGKQLIPKPKIMQNTHHHTCTHSINCVKTNSGGDVHCKRNIFQRTRCSSPIQGSKRSEPKSRLKNTEGSIFTWNGLMRSRAVNKWTTSSGKLPTYWTGKNEEWESLSRLKANIFFCQIWFILIYPSDKQVESWSCFIPELLRASSTPQNLFKLSFCHSPPAIALLAGHISLLDSRLAFPVVLFPLTNMGVRRVVVDTCSAELQSSCSSYLQHMMAISKHMRCESATRLFLSLVHQIQP